MSFLMPESDWRPPLISDLPSWAGAKRVGFDCETKDLLLKDFGPGTRRGAHTTGYSFAIEDGPDFYLPIRHEGGDNMPVEEVLKYLRHQLKNFDGEIVGANLPYDIDFAGTDDLEFHPDVKFRDIQIADPLIYEMHFSYSLKSIGERWGFESKNEELLIRAAKALGLSPKGGMWRLPARYVGPYASGDSRSPLLIYEAQRKVLTEKDLWSVFDLETDVLPVLVRMRQRGVKIDLDKLDEISRWALTEETKALKEVKRATGIEIAVGQVWKPGALAPALEAVGVKLGRTSTGAPQIDKDLLKALKNPTADNILRARKVNKIRTTFVSSLERYMVNGRLHCTFNQMVREDEKGEQKGVRYGRLSAADPNMQQQPSPDRDREIAGEWRKNFIPEDGAIWGCNDYSQQEPRWTTHFAAVMDLPKAAEAAKRYRDDPTVDNHDMMTRLVHSDAEVEEWVANQPKLYKTNRGYAKNLFLGLCYGEGGVKLCQDLGKPTRWSLITGWGRNREVHYRETRHEIWALRKELQTGLIKEAAGVEGQEIIDKFDAEVPYVRKLAQKASNQAEKNGYVKTISGRRLHFTQRDNGSYDWTHKALNRVIQGSSADQTKKALVGVDRAGYFLQLQVHDEINCSFGSVAEAKEVGRIMKDCVFDICEPLVPFNVDTEIGSSWGEIKEV